MSPVHEEVAHALVAFVDGARRYARGLFFESNAMQDAGFAIMNEAKVVFETRTGNLDILIPLLEHGDPSVRLCAARSLLDDHYDLILPILHDLDENCVTEASRCAALYLQLYGEPNSGSGFKKPDPAIFNEKPNPRRRP